MTNETTHDWPNGWESVEHEDSGVFVAQLLSETGPMEWMRPETLTCIGRFGGSDDMVFALVGWQAPFFVAHLSWSGPDTRGWVARKLRPWPKLAPALIPLKSIADLANYFD